LSLFYGSSRRKFRAMKTHSKSWLKKNYATQVRKIDS
jgi:hypothetical protein